MSKDKILISFLFVFLLTVSLSRATINLESDGDGSCGCIIENDSIDEICNRCNPDRGKTIDTAKFVGPGTRNFISDYEHFEAPYKKELCKMENITILNETIEYGGNIIRKNVEIEPGETFGWNITRTGRGPFHIFNPSDKINVIRTYETICSSPGILFKTDTGLEPGTKEIIISFGSSSIVTKVIVKGEEKETTSTKTNVSGEVKEKIDNLEYKLQDREEKLNETVKSLNSAKERIDNLTKKIENLEKSNEKKNKSIFSSIISFFTGIF